jgi:hypothetical protein
MIRRSRHSCLGPQHCRAGWVPVYVACLGLILALQQARADEPPPDVEPCWQHRAGDRCVTETERLDGTCQDSKCPRWKREPVSCLKCIPNHPASEKKTPDSPRTTKAGNSCSFAGAGSAVRRVTLWLAAGAISILIPAVRRRRR